MERIRRCAADYFFWGVLGALLGGGGAWGQGIGRAVVYPVPTTGEASRFRVPQVRLADAAAARRINRVLLSNALLGSGQSLGSKVSPAQWLRQAALNCCYNPDAHAWEAAGNGLTGSNYHVLLNRGGLLSLSITRQSNGSSYACATDFLTFDLHTGRRLFLADVVADPPRQLARRLQAAVSRRLRSELAEAVSNYGNDSARIAYVAQRFQLETWDTTPQTGLRLDTANGAEANFNDFALAPNALLLFYAPEMQRIEGDPQPGATYVFPYGRIQPRKLLLPVAQAALRKRRPR